MCFGFCLPTSYTAIPVTEQHDRQPELKPAPKEEPAESAVLEIVKPKRPTTNWRDIPLVAKYELIKQISKGGFAEIWLAERKETRETEVLKVVHLANTDLEPEEVATLLAEAKFLRTLDCPYLLQCYESFATDDWLVLTLEYLPGGELLDHIHKVTKYTEAEAAKLFAQVVSAISYLHNLNLIHRDIKPENIMFTSPVEEFEAEGRLLRVKVIDLGMAALYDPKKEIRGCIGTPGFVAPEIWNDGPHTPAGDIYSLGIVLFIMLTGRKPHGGLDIRMMTYCNKSIQDAPGLKDERFLALSAAARELLLLMLSDDPLHRPTCMAVLRHPFITAVDSNADAHREMGDMVRRRMRDLAQLRRIHGLRYALRVQKPQGADHHAFLNVMDQRRLKLKGEMGTFGRNSEAQVAFGRNSEAHGVPAFGRCSLARSYATAPPVITAPVRDSRMPGTRPASAAATSRSASSSAGAAAAAAAVDSNSASPTVASTPTYVSPFATVSEGTGSGGGASGLPHPPRARLPMLRHTPDDGGGGSGARPAGSYVTVSTPDAISHDMGVPMPDGLVARAPGRLISREFGLHHTTVNPMVLVNALPTLRHCSSMDDLAIGEEGERLDGGSPVASAALVEKALLTKCMSANQFTLELLGHQASIARVLDDVIVEPEDPLLMLVDSAMHHPEQFALQPRKAGSQ